jgi:hypothetical protein
MYQVIVGNIGLVYEGTSKSTAIETFRAYKQQSLSDHGRAGGQPVHLVNEQGETLQEIFPVRWEVTDTFAGESNYSWVDRGVAVTCKQAMREVRKRIPYGQVVSDTGDMLEIRHSRICRVGFIYLF